jgi:hypothetical protein
MAPNGTKEPPVRSHLVCPDERPARRSGQPVRLAAHVLPGSTCHADLAGLGELWRQPVTSARRCGGRSASIQPFSVTNRGSSLAYANVLGVGRPIQDGDPPRHQLVCVGLLLFSSGLFVNSPQPVAQGMTGDMVPADERALRWAWRI